MCSKSWTRTKLGKAVKRLVDRGVESLAIGFLNSYVNPSHERRQGHRARGVLGSFRVYLGGYRAGVWRVRADAYHGRQHRRAAAHHAVHEELREVHRRK